MPWVTRCVKEILFTVCLFEINVCFYFTVLKITIMSKNGKLVLSCSIVNFKQGCSEFRV